MLVTGNILQNRYEIIKPVGQGGMGAVYMAKDQRLGNIVALKETFFSDAFLLAAFEREARILAGLRHGALPKVIDHFPDTDGHFLVMEYISGDDLQDLLEKSGPPSINKVLGWADQLLDALDYLHSQHPPVIHRDIKPQNLKLTSRNQIVLLDFGLAKGTAPERTHTGSNSNSSIFGYTPGYAPLEQAQGSGTCPQSDIYSLTGTLYHLLTGRKPVDAVSRATCVMNGEPDPLASASELNPHISLELNEIIMMGMALKKSERPSSADEMRRMLRGLAHMVGRDGAADAQTELARTQMSEGGGPTASPVSSTQVLASAQTTPQAQPGGAVSFTPRASATNPRRAMPVRVPEKRLNPARPASAAYKRPAAVEMASGGATGLSRVVMAGVAAVVAIAAIIFAFKPDSKDENTNTTPVVIQRIEQVAGSEKPDAGAKPAVEAPGVANSRTETVAPSEQPVAEEQTRDQDDDKDKAGDMRVKEGARQEESTQESERAGTGPAEAAQTQPSRRPEETVRDEPMRQPPPPPPHHLHRPPPPPFPPPRDMPPPPGRRRP
jgi:serine/threonine protein kinase